MYQDSELTTCPTCNGIGLVAPSLWGTPTFFHKIPSPRLQGYYTFTDEHSEK